MKRYPHGAAGPFFFMKRAPTPRPGGFRPARSPTARGNVIDFPDDSGSAALMWVVNLGCIDLNQWYARCDDVDRPDYLHFDLDPGDGRTFDHVLRGRARRPRRPRRAEDAGARKDHRLARDCTCTCRSCADPFRSRSGRLQRRWRRNWRVAHPALMTAEYRVANRPRGRVLVDYNQNAWGRTLALDLLGAPASRGDCLGARDVAGGRRRPPDRGLHDPQRAETHRETGRPLEKAAAGARSR